MSAPPTAGPSAAPVAPAAAQTATARRSEPSAIGISSSAAVTAAAPPTACTQRAAISVFSSSATPQARLAPAKTASPSAATRPAPTRRASSAAGTAASAEDEVEGDQHPGHPGDAGVQLAVDLWESENDDRAVGQDEPDGNRQRRRPRPRPGPQ